MLWILTHKLVKLSKALSDWFIIISEEIVIDSNMWQQYIHILDNPIKMDPNILL